MSTVEGMADLPFGFSSGDDPDRDKPKKDPDSGGDPFGMGGSEFDMSQLGQIFSRLGEMFSGAGSAMAGGKQSGLNPCYHPMKFPLLTIRIVHLLTTGCCYQPVGNTTRRLRKSTDGVLA